MKKFLKVTGILLGVVVILMIGAVVYINSAFPDVGEPPQITVKTDSVTLARGEYLVTHVNACFDCHAENDFKKFGGKHIAGTEGRGGNKYGEEAGFPGNFYAANLTPHHLGDWTDGEIARAIRAGVSKDGRALFPLMPYASYRYLADEDIAAIIAYLRSMEPIENDVPVSEAAFPFSMILKMIPGPADPMDKPDGSDPVKLGEYLAHVGGCVDCHTPVIDNTPDMTRVFAGGHEYPLPTGGVCRSANITPHVETGIGAWTKDQFIARFRYYKDNDSLFVKPGEFNTLMPWYAYSGMKDEDLGAIYDYLKTQKPVNNFVTKFSPDVIQ